MKRHPDSRTVFTIDPAEQEIIRTALRNQLHLINEAVIAARRVGNEVAAQALLAGAVLVADVLDEMVV